ALPGNYRQVLELRFLRGYSLRETAEAMNNTVGAIKVMQLRALRAAAHLPACGEVGSARSAQPGGGPPPSETLGGDATKTRPARPRRSHPLRAGARGSACATAPAAQGG